jgi:transposase
MKKVAGLLKRRFENIITYLTHPITNATSESINAKIQWVKYTARGFRDKQNFIDAIYFHCGGLDLALGPPENPVGRKNISSATLIERTRLK